ncbi:unnamed protein product [Adineta ricciae]|uniref:G-protein coupled receptors family 1 profile domain-containing protein n=1 Tax=Adineta ricciae TaxID=249248 RepID=A0A816H6C4_ADIRI|nr:unnamed protein product [Adineta ricciae]
MKKASVTCFISVLGVNITSMEKLELATYWINQIYPVLQIFFGTFGNLLNIIIFTRRDLHQNPCSLYFLIGSINNCIVIDFGLLTRYLASTWNWDPSLTSNVYCKIRNLLVYAPLTLSLWFIVLASVDRYLLSSPIVRFRRLSNLSMARKLILIL